MTPNQIILLRAACGTVPPTTADLALLLNEHGDSFGENAARNAMSRMEARGLVQGVGRGKMRAWMPTTEGRALFAQLEPEAPAESTLRGYVVLEECSLANVIRDRLPDQWAPTLAFGASGALQDLLDTVDTMLVYARVADVTARNTEHAYRQAAKSIYADGDNSPTLIAVAEKQWRPTEVRIQTRQTVSVGG